MLSGAIKVLVIAIAVAGDDGGDLSFLPSVHQSLPPP